MHFKILKRRHSLNNVLVNLEIIIVHVTIFSANCSAFDALYIVIVTNCGIFRNNLVKLVS